MDDREEVSNELCNGPSKPTSKTNKNVVRVRAELHSDRRLTVWMIANNLNIPKTIVHKLVIDKLNLRKVCAKLVSKVLSDN